MKIRLALLILWLSVATSSVAQTDKYIYAHSDKYLYRQAKVIDNNTNKVVEDFGYGNNGVIVFFADKEVECIAVTFGSETLYAIQVVNTVVDYPSKDIKIEMKQGGVMDGDKVVGTIDVYRVWDFSRDKLNPQSIRTHVNGAEVAFEFYDISIINK